MGKRKQSAKYYFTVEGETEKWYFEWLRDTINADQRATATLSCSPKVEKSPLKWAKSHTNLGRTANVYHVFDFEDEEPAHVQEFHDTLREMKAAGRLGRGFRYVNAYSNLTFELWMILHKGDCRAMANRRQYLEPINRQYNERFEDLREYKREANFKRVLGKLTLDDVGEAVRRSERLSQHAQDSGFRTEEYCGFRYHLDNPVTELWVPVKRILQDCGLI